MWFFVLVKIKRNWVCLLSSGLSLRLDGNKKSKGDSVETGASELASLDFFTVNQWICPPVRQSAVTTVTSPLDFTVSSFAQVTRVLVLPWCFYWSTKENIRNETLIENWVVSDSQRVNVDPTQSQVLLTAAVTSGWNPETLSRSTFRSDPWWCNMAAFFQVAPLCAQCKCLLIVVASCVF